MPVADFAPLCFRQHVILGSCTRRFPEAGSVDSDAIAVDSHVREPGIAMGFKEGLDARQNGFPLLVAAPATTVQPCRKAGHSGFCGVPGHPACNSFLGGILASASDDSKSLADPGCLPRCLWRQVGFHERLDCLPECGHGAGHLGGQAFQKCDSCDAIVSSCRLLDGIGQRRTSWITVQRLEKTVTCPPRQPEYRSCGLPGRLWRPCQHQACAGQVRFRQH